MKTILKSYSPQRLVKILNGEATTDIWKTIPQCLKNGEPVEVQMYCTKEQSFNYRLWCSPEHYTNKCYIEAFSHNMFDKKLNGLVVAKFRVEKYDLITCVNPSGHSPTYWCDDFNFWKNAQIDEDTLGNYLKEKLGYALHITALEILEKPLPLTEFKKTSSKLVKGDKNGKGLERSDKLVYTHEPLTKAPMSWCYVIPPGGKKE